MALPRNSLGPRFFSLSFYFPKKGYRESIVEATKINIFIVTKRLRFIVITVIITNIIILSLSMGKP